MHSILLQIQKCSNFDEVSVQNKKGKTRGGEMSTCPIQGKTNKAEKPGLEHYFHRHQVDKLLPLIIC